MRYAVTDRRYRDDPFFIVTNGKFSVTTMTVFAAVQIFTKFAQIPLQIILKHMQFRGGSFAFAESKPAVPHIS